MVDYIPKHAENWSRVQDSEGRKVLVSQQSLPEKCSAEKVELALKMFIDGINQKQDLVELAQRIRKIDPMTMSLLVKQAVLTAGTERVGAHWQQKKD